MRIFPDVFKQIAAQLFESPLFYRIYYNDVAGVRDYCRTNVPFSELNSLNAAGITPLALAVKGKNLTMIQTLIDFGADVNGGDRVGRTPFVHALAGQVSAHKWEILDLLLKNGADANEPDKTGRGGVFYALQSKDPALLGYVLKNGGNPDQQATDGSTPVLTAINQCCEEAVRQLMAAGADMYAENKYGVTPWQAARRFLSETACQSLKSFEHQLLKCSAHTLPSGVLEDMSAHIHT